MDPSYLFVLYVWTESVNDGKGRYVSFLVKETPKHHSKPCNTLSCTITLDLTSIPKQKNNKTKREIIANLNL